MKVYVIRHGQSETNLESKWTGWLDVSLTDKGREDAKSAGKIIQNVIFDKIYTSDLVRARQTAELALPNCCYETSLLLREIDVGTIAGKPLSVLTDEQRARVSKQGYTEFDGESREQLYQRINEVMRGLEKSGFENVALFSHAGFMCAMLNAVLGFEISRKNVCCNNCTLAIFEYNNGIWRLHSWINL